MQAPPPSPPFIVRHPWLFLVLAFALLLGAWSLLIVVAVKSAPQRIEWKSPSR